MIKGLIKASVLPLTMFFAVNTTAQTFKEWQDPKVNQVNPKFKVPCVKQPLTKKNIAIVK